MKKCEITMKEMERAAEIVRLPLMSEAKEDILDLLEVWTNDNNDVMEEVMKPEYDYTAPITVVSFFH